MTGRDALRLVAVREIKTTTREKSFLISFAISLAIVVLVAVVPPLIGLGGRDTYEIGATGGQSRVVAEAAARGADAFDADVHVRTIAPGDVQAAVADGTVDAVVDGNRIRAQEDPDDDLVGILQIANRQVRAGAALRDAGISPEQAQRALAPPPLELAVADPRSESAEKRQGLAYVAVLILYGQLIGFGFIVASGVVEEKTSRIVEILLSTLRPWQLLGGKVLGLGLVGLGQLLGLAVLGLGAATAAGALELDGDVLMTAAIAIGWFVLGYAFYAALFATAASLVPRQEELQSVTTPLTLLLVVSFVVSFSALDDPDGAVATVASFIPFSAPLVMPPRVALGEASAAEIAGAFAITLGATALLVPIAGRIYAGAVLRTGRTVKLREAWRAAPGRRERTA